jgi:hypothetical protein
MSKKLSNIRDILSDYEFEYNHNDWLELEKDLSKSSKSFKFSKLAIISSITAIIIAIIAYLVINVNMEPNDTIANDIPITENNITDNLANHNISNPNQIEGINTTEELSKSIISEKSTDKNTIVETLNTNNNNTPVVVSTPSCSDNNTENLNTNASPNMPNETLEDIKNIRLEIKISNNCTPAKVEFSAMNVPSGYDVKWNTDDNNMLTGTNVEYTYNDGGNYFPEASIVSNDLVLQKHKMKKLEIKKSNSAKINIEKYNNNTFLFTGLSDHNAKVSYTWYIMKQSYINQNMIYSFDKDGKYKIYLTVGNNNGCVSTVAEDIEIRTKLELSIPNEFIPNKNKKINYFGPNKIDVNLKRYYLSIKNSDGNIIFTSEDINNKWNGTLNDSINAETGIYIWEIDSEDIFGNIFNEKGNVDVSWE